MKKPGSVCKGTAVLLTIIAAIILFGSVIVVAGKFVEFPLYAVINGSIVTIIVGALCLAIFAVLLTAVGDLLDILNQQKNYIGMLLVQQMQKDGTEIPANLQNDIEHSNE
jgi:hypothetical protein